MPAGHIGLLRHALDGRLDEALSTLNEYLFCGPQLGLTAVPGHGPYVGINLSEPLVVFDMELDGAQELLRVVVLVRGENDTDVGIADDAPERVAHGADVRLHMPAGHEQHLFRLGPVLIQQPIGERLLKGFVKGGVLQAVFKEEPKVFFALDGLILDPYIILNLNVSIIDLEVFNTSFNISLSI